MHVRGPVVAFGHDRYSKLSKLEEEDWWNASKEISELDLERYLYFIPQAASLDPIISVLLHCGREPDQGSL